MEPHEFATRTTSGAGPPSRRHLLRTLGGGLLAAGGAPHGAARAASFTSGGLGWTFAQWDAAFGPAQAGQGAPYHTISGIRYYLRGQGGVVTSIGWTQGGRAGADVATAFAQARRFLPSDAVLQEAYNVDPFGIGTVAWVYRWQSAALVGRLTDPRLARTGTILLVCQAMSDLSGKVDVCALQVGEQPG